MCLMPALVHKPLKEASEGVWDSGFAARVGSAAPGTDDAAIHMDKI